MAKRARGVWEEPLARSLRKMGKAGGEYGAGTREDREDAKGAEAVVEAETFSAESEPRSACLRWGPTCGEGSVLHGSPDPRAQKRDGVDSVLVFVFPGRGRRDLLMARSFERSDSDSSGPAGRPVKDAPENRRVAEVPEQFAEKDWWGTEWPG